MSPPAGGAEGWGTMAEDFTRLILAQKTVGLPPAQSKPTLPRMSLS